MAGYLLDTNVLLRLTRRGDAPQILIQRVIRQFIEQDAKICYCPQNIAELWNVMTRPTKQNGFGLSVVEAEEEVLLIERAFTLLPDNEQIYPIWRRLIAEHGVHGRQVHDARLVATMLVHGLSNLLTLNRTDFLRYKEIVAVDPKKFETAG